MNLLQAVKDVSIIFADQRWHLLSTKCQKLSRFHLDFSSIRWLSQFSPLQLAEMY